MKLASRLRKAINALGDMRLSIADRARDAELLLYQELLVDRALRYLDSAEDALQDVERELHRGFGAGTATRADQEEA